MSGSSNFSSAATPQIIDAYTERVGTKTGVLIWPAASVEAMSATRWEYPEAWFRTLGLRIPWKDNSALLGELGNVGPLGVEYEGDASCEYWDTEEEVGRQDRARRGGCMEAIWNEIARYQSVFNQLLGPSRLVNEHLIYGQVLMLQHHLDRQCTIGFEFDRPTGAPKRITFYANGALGTAWHQLAENYIHPQGFGVCECPGCDREFVLGKARGIPRKYCGDSCKVKASKLRNQVS